MKRCFTRLLSTCFAVSIVFLPGSTFAEQAIKGSSRPTGHPAATAIIDQVIDRLANGKAFDAKIRQRVWASGREVVGVGTYVQAGNGSGAFSLQLTMHDGNGKHTLQQVSDGRLAYTRSEIGGEVSLRRVDVGWLDEGARTLRRNPRIKPSMKVGGPGEMLDTIRRDYDLRVGVSKLDETALHVVIGTLKPSRREAILAETGRQDLPVLYPTRVNVFITATDDPETGVARGLPIRVEHRNETNDSPRASDANHGRLISLIEFYSLRAISPPPIQRFRFENQDASVTFVNETSRYEDRFDIRVSAKERARYR